MLDRWGHCTVGRSRFRFEEVGQRPTGRGMLSSGRALMLGRRVAPPISECPVYPRVQQG
jgi:hypothetical protein